MHRSYNSYNPVASKLLQKRWDEKHFSDHRRAVISQFNYFDVFKDFFVVEEAYFIDKILYKKLSYFQKLCFKYI